MTPMSNKRVLVLGVAAGLVLALQTSADAQYQYIRINNLLYPEVPLPSPVANVPLSSVMPVDCPVRPGIMSAAAVIPAGGSCCPSAVGTGTLRLGAGAPYLGASSLGGGYGRAGLGIGSPLGYNAPYDLGPGWGSRMVSNAAVTTPCGYGGNVRRRNGLRIIHPSDVSPFGIFHPNNWWSRTLDYMGN